MSRKDADIAQRILKARHAAGLGLVIASERSGISPKSISAYERGFGVPSVEQIGKLAEAYGVEVSELTGVEVETDEVEATAQDKPLVIIEAVDWATYGDQTCHVDNQFNLLNATLCGILVEEDEERLVIANQWFDNGTLRYVMVIPKSTIINRFDIANPFAVGGDGKMVVSNGVEVADVLKGLAAMKEAVLKAK